MEKLREKEGRGSAPFPALAGAGRCLPGPPGHSDSDAGSAAPPAAGARRDGQCSLPLPGRGFLPAAGREAHGVSRGKAGRELLRARAAPVPRICLPARAGTGAAPATAGAAGTRAAPAAEAAAGGGPGRAASGGAAAASHKGQIHFPRPERGGGKAQCRVGPTATGGLWGEDLARERKASCLLDSVELYHVRKTSYYHDHLKLLESHSVFLFLIFGSLVFLVFFNRVCQNLHTMCVENH